MEKESLIPKTSISTIYYVIASMALLIIGLIYFDSLIKPFVIATLIWFIINQLKNVIEKVKIRNKPLPSAISSTLAFIIIFSLIVIITELLIRNMTGIIESMPDYLAKLKQSYTGLSASLNDPKYSDSIHNWMNEIDLKSIAKSLLSSLTGVFSNFAIVTVYVIFFLIEDSMQRSKIEKLFPEKGKDYRKFMNNLNHIAVAISSYISSKTLISLITGGVSFVILILMGVEYPLLWSFLIFILNFIPYLGPLLSSLFPAIFAVLITSDLMQFIYVFGAMEGIQIILGNFIEPKLMGKGSNLGPVTVIVALAFWGIIWGIVGMILAVPVTAVIVIILSQIPSTRYIAVLLSEKGNIIDIED